jgi:hypothetical protein
MQNHTIDPTIELNGDTTYAFLSSINASEFAHILEKHGLNDIDRTQWYPLHKVLEVLSDIAHANNATTNLVSIGMAAVANAALPPGIEKITPEAFFKQYEQVYPTRHRNGSPGTVTATMVGDHKMHVILDAGVPYPDDTMYGVFYAYMRLLDTHGGFTVAYPKDRPRKAEGGSETVYELTWHLR